MSLLYLPETKAAPLLANVYKLKNYDHFESKLEDSDKLGAKEVHSNVLQHEIETLQNEVLGVTKIMRAMRKKWRQMLRRIQNLRLHRLT